MLLDYDALDRPVKQTVSRGGAAAADVLFQYLGLSPLLSKEEHKDQAGTLLRTKTYSLHARGQRTGMTHTPAGGPSERYTYGVDPQSSVSLLLDAGSGAVRAAYAYRPYGAEDTALTKGDADPNAILPYRFQGKRLDVISGTLDMGARRFGPDLRASCRPTATRVRAPVWTGELTDSAISRLRAYLR